MVLCCIPSKCLALLQDRDKPVPALTICGDRLKVINNLEYPGSLVTRGGDVGMEVTPLIAKARGGSANLRHLQCRHDFQISLRVMPLFVVLFSAVARPGLSSLRKPGDFLYSTTDASEVLVVSGGNIG